MCHWQWHCRCQCQLGALLVTSAGARGNDLPEVGVKSFKERVCVCDLPEVGVKSFKRACVCVCVWQT